MHTPHNTLGRPIEGDALDFILAGNAIVTLVSKRTGERFTFKVRQAEDKPEWFVSVLNGSNNESDYMYLGMIRRGSFELTRKSIERGFTNAIPSVKAFGYTFLNLKYQKRAPGVEIWHEGRCGRCGRTLTVPSSLASGLGPECAARMGMAVAA